MPRAVTFQPFGLKGMAAQAPVGVHASMGSKILKGDRSLTLGPIRKLAARFKVGPELCVA